MKQSVPARLFIFSLLLFFCSSFADNTKTTGIKFFTGTYQQALAEAQKEGKPIFIDAYTTWCGPCRMLAQKTFTDKKVGEFYNEHFINLQVDMEHGEGPALAAKYKVTHYPTLIIACSDGKRVAFTIGYIIPEDMLAFADWGLKQYKPELTECNGN